ncbi:MAG: sugar ABC transporter ATP-binding protein [Clostridiales Family XIII bacterium]|jgi:ribose transport system ATP-binding protein|nr:sugar ABC transporter ATP-binding protein [Clostridiales Family XIII bacterium]
MSILELKNISKSFTGTQVLFGVDFFVEEGEIHALLGENGAGKSTLMNILAGVLPMDNGSITFDGQEYYNPSIQQMEKAGLAFVHQELNVVNDLTVSENIFLNREIVGKTRKLNKKEMLAQSRKLFDDLGVDIDPTILVSELKTSQKQLLEICRALYADAKLLILDEPTTALSNDEIERLFGILKALKKTGKSFIFISHKMPEIFDLADRYTVLRNGKLISTGDIKDTTTFDITCDMVGEQFVDKETYAEHELGEIALELQNYSGQGFSDVNLRVKKGEVVAFTGLAGSGASELMQSMFGALRVESGSMFFKGKDVRGNITKFMKSHIAMLPTNRKENSVIPDMTVLENSYIAEHSLSRKYPVINKKREIVKYDDLKGKLNIKAQSPDDLITSLSGGNQQKVFLARWLNTEAEILLFDNPTQGVDVGAKEEIYELIMRFAEAGKTVIINTLEIPEIKKVSDRCVVFYAGRVVKIFDHEEINERDVMLYSTNAIDAAAGSESMEDN